MSGKIGTSDADDGVDGSTRAPDKNGLFGQSGRVRKVFAR